MSRSITGKSSVNLTVDSLSFLGITCANVETVNLTATNAEITNLELENLTIDEITLNTINATDVNTTNLNGNDVDTFINQIDTNTTNIQTNSDDINENSIQIVGLQQDVDTNTTNIQTNTDNINQNTILINQNTNDITTNTNDITTINNTLTGYETSFNTQEIIIEKDGMDSSNFGLLIKPVTDYTNDATMSIRGHRDGSSSNIQAQLYFQNYDRDEDPPLPATNNLGMIGGIVDDAVLNTGHMGLFSSNDGTVLQEELQVKNNEIIILNNLTVNGNINGYYLNVFDTEIQQNTIDIQQNTANIETNTLGIDLLNNSIETMQTDISNLELDVTTNTTDISNLELDVNTNATDISNLEVNVNTNTTDIIGIENTLNDMDTNIYTENIYCNYIELTGDGSTTDILKFSSNETNIIFNDRVRISNADGSGNLNICNNIDDDNQFIESNYTACKFTTSISDVDCRIGMLMSTDLGSPGDGIAMTSGVMLSENILKFYQNPAAGGAIGNGVLKASISCLTGDIICNDITCDTVNASTYNVTTLTPTNIQCDNIKTTDNLVYNSFTIYTVIDLAQLYNDNSWGRGWHIEQQTGQTTYYYSHNKQFNYDATNQGYKINGTGNSGFYEITAEVVVQNTGSAREVFIIGIAKNDDLNTGSPVGPKINENFSGYNPFDASYARMSEGMVVKLRAIRGLYLNSSSDIISINTYAMSGNGEEFTDTSYCRIYSCNIKFKYLGNYTGLKTGLLII